MKATDGKMRLTNLNAKTILENKLKLESAIG